MKFVNYLEKISGVGVYPMISLVLFTVLFTSVVVYALKVSRETISRMEQLPLDDE